MLRTPDLRARLRWEPGLQRLLLLALAAKITILAIICLSYYLLPFCEPCYRSNFVHAPDEPIYLLVLIPSAALQVLFLAAHCLNYWIA